MSRDTNIQFHFINIVRCQSYYIVRTVIAQHLQKLIVPKKEASSDNNEGKTDCRLYECFFQSRSQAKSYGREGVAYFL